MRLHIRAKLLLGFALVLGLFFLIQTFIFKASDQTLRTQIRSVQLEKAQNAAGEIQNFFTKIELDHLGIAREFAKAPASDYSPVLNIITFTLRQNTFFEKISLLTPSGRELIKVDRFGRKPEEALGFEIPTTPFDLAVAGQTGISKVFFSETTSVPQLNIFSPIISDEGTVVGIIKGQLTLDRLWDLIAQVKLGKKGFAYVVDEEGRLIAHPDLSLVLKGPNLSSRKIILSLLSDSHQVLKSENYLYVNDKEIQVISNGVKIPKLGWVVLVEQPTSEAFSPLTSLRNLFYATFIGSLVLLVIISFLVSESFTRPIRELESATTLLQQGLLDTRVDIRSGDEIEELANSFNVMAAQLKGSIQELEKKILQLEEQKHRLDLTAQLLLRRDLDIRAMNEELEREKENITAERNKLEVIISGITDAVIAVDQERRIIIFNRAAESLTGFLSEKVSGRPINQVIHIFEKDEELDAQTYCPFRTGDFEGNTFNKNGLRMLGAKNKEAYVNLIAGQIKEGTKVNLGCILTLHDVTQERELEEMKLDFVSMAAHELRTPLTAIRGYTSLLLSEIGEQLDQQHKEDLHRLSTSAINLANLIDNLLHVSRIEQGTFKVSIAPTDIVSIVREAIKEFEEQVSSKSQTLEFVEPQGILPKVMADHSSIAQVLINLISNAVSYTKPGGKITVSINKKGKSIAVSVSDTGIGIPREALPKLFTKFFRVSGPLEEGSKGTGLGLFISKSIVEMNRGDIWVESELGKGSTFTFTLPLPTKEELALYEKTKRKSELPDTTAGAIIMNKERYRN